MMVAQTTKARCQSMSLSCLAFGCAFHTGSLCIILYREYRAHFVDHFVSFAARQINNRDAATFKKMKFRQEGRPQASRRNL